MGASTPLGQRQAGSASGASPALLVPPREAARLLSISERTLWTFTKRGAIPAVKIGRAVRYDQADLRAFVEQSKAKGAGDDHK